MLLNKFFLEQYLIFYKQNKATTIIVNTSMTIISYNL